MKIGFVSDSLSTSAGGIFEIERSLALHLRELGMDVSAWGIRDEFWEEVRPQWDGVPCHVRSRLGPKGFGYAPGLVGDLVASDRDLLHLQHLWMYPSMAVKQWHRRTGKPFLVTANGMLEPWTLSTSRFKKAVASFIYENRMLRAAGCLQANTRKEAEDFRNYGLRNPVCIIPNGVELPGDDFMSLPKRRHDETRILLFLGRLHPKKGLVNALKAWALVTGGGTGKGWRFVIAGWDQGGHGEELKSLCRELGITFAVNTSAEVGPDLIEPGAASVIFTGPVFGEAKEALLRSADAFILPSFSEGLPMAVLEAWAHGLPVLMTDFCNLPEGFSADAALRIGTDVDTLAGGLRELFEGSATDLATMGARGRRLVEERFTWPEVAAQMKEVYEWLVGGGARPGCLW